MDKPRWPWRLLLGWLLGLIVVGGATAVFIDLAEDVWLKEGFSWDVPVMLAIHRSARPWLTGLMRYVTQAGSGAAVAVLGISAYWLWHLGRRPDALTVLASFIGAVAQSTGFKLLFARPRPEVFPPLGPESGYSFPSGHTIAAVAVYGSLAVLLWRRGHRGWALLSALWIPLVGFSRIYLGAHYPSDVVASLALGTIWLFAVMVVHDWVARRQPD